MNTRSGFSFLELIVAVAILAILATIVGVKVIPHIGKSKVTTARTQIENISSALKLYQIDTGVYPNQAQGLDALCVKPTMPPVPAIHNVGSVQ